MIYSHRHETLTNDLEVLYKVELTTNGGLTIQWVLDTNHRAGLLVSVVGTLSAEDIKPRCQRRRCRASVPSFANAYSSHLGRKVPPSHHSLLDGHFWHCVTVDAFGIEAW